MKKNLLVLAVTAVCASVSFAQTPAPAGTVPVPTNPTAAPAVVKAVPPVAATKPAAPTVAAKSAIQGVCKDGSAFEGDTIKGACRGHGGVDKKATKAANASSQAPAPTAAANAGATPATKPAIPPLAQAPGGGAGKVWGNTSSKVYHCANDKYYGKTKRGEYMSEADAKSKGFHADHGKACAA